MSDLRERRQQERAHRIALRIHAEREEGKTPNYPSLNEICSPLVNAPRWEAPPPPPESIAAMAAFGISVGPEDAVSAQTVPPARMEDSQREAAITEAIDRGDERSLTAAISDGISAALASMGFKRAAPVPPAAADAPRNEDR